MSETTEQPHDAGTPDGSPSTPGKVAVVGVVVLVLMVLLAVVAVLAFDAEEDDDVLVDEPTTAPTTMEPSEPEPADPAEPAGADSALVGLTEAEVREMYPVVRVVEVDGEPLATTMDLQPGRINLALDGDTVVGATAEACDELTGQEPVWMQQSCDPDPGTDGPQADGKLLADADGGFTLEVGTQGDQYHQGMAVEVDPDRTVVRGSDGAPLSAQDLTADDVVWIWTAECAESSPVQCTIDAIVVDRPA